jgi:hypothetical protein
MKMNQIRLHEADGLHSWGLEFNFLPQDKEQDASEFIIACKTVLSKNYCWFFQCGSESKTGYKYFELWNDDIFVLLSEAEKVAKEIDAEIVVPLSILEKIILNNA